MGFFPGGLAELSTCFSQFMCLYCSEIQCYEGKPIFEFDRTRTFRSGLVGFTLHGSLSHYYYQFCEVIIVVWVLFISLHLLSCWCHLDGWNRLHWFLGSFSFWRLVGGPSQSCLWPNSLGSNLEQHLLCGARFVAFWVPRQYF